jgi:2-polyprenyl-3-methyl-5-hydroxy-6-metoxy-1,4-benzoquinol methylase
MHKTLDIDPSGRYDFQNLDEVAETFDTVVAWEVIEHLPLEAIPGWLAELKRVMAPGGRVILSTPNVYRPGQYWKDASHRTPLAYTELGALLILAGFEVLSLHRTYHGSWLQYALLRWSPPGLLLPLWDLDFAQSVVAVAQAR